MDLLDVLIFSAGEGGYAHGDLVHTVASTSTRAVMLPICAPVFPLQSENACRGHITYFFNSEHDCVLLHRALRSHSMTFGNCTITPGPIA